MVVENTLTYLCAGGLMGLPLVISEYRERKILKRFHVTPVSPIKLLLVEFSIYVVYCIVSMLTLIIASALFWNVRITGSVTAFLCSYILTMVSTLSIGMMVGGVAKNSKSASVIASLLYFPMLVFSGATLPLEVMPAVVQKIVSIFPLTQGIMLMKTAFLGLPDKNVVLPVIVMTSVTIICSGIAIKFFKWE